MVLRQAYQDNNDKTKGVKIMETKQKFDNLLIPGTVFLGIGLIATFIGVIVVFFPTLSYVFTSDLIVVEKAIEIGKTIIIYSTTTTIVGFLLIQFSPNDYAQPSITSQYTNNYGRIR